MPPASTSSGQSVSVPRHALRRGTRGFGAVVLVLIATITLAVAVFVLPSAPLDRLALSWLIPLTFAFGIAHLAATYGIARRRAWVVSLTTNLAMIGIGVAAFGILLSLTGADPFGPTSALPAERARSEGIGLLIWMIGAWSVAARFVVRGMAASVARSEDLAPVVVMRVPAPEPDAQRGSLLVAERASAV